MSADWPTQSAESWKVTFRCTRAEGEAIAQRTADFDLDPEPVLMASETDPAEPEAWQIDAHVGREPDAALIERLRALARSAGDTPPTVTRIADADWVTLSQSFLEPIRAGRFYVHTAAHADRIPLEAIAFRIEAGRAFGTGHHETTAGCLTALDRLAQGGRSFSRIADIGTGTGLLAFAARALWPEAMILASDIDPVAIDVTTENMIMNGIAADAITLVAADGMSDPRIRRVAPFDLVAANILAGPLIALAPAIAANLAPTGVIILAGLLAGQAADVLAAYEAVGMRPAGRIDSGDWSILTLVQAP